MPKAKSKPKQLRGFAAMSPEKQRSIASKGGRTIARDREHMSSIGQKGGLTTGRLGSKVRRVSKMFGAKV